jgi:hypothetical protein
MSQQLVEKLQQLLISDSTLISEVLLELVFNSVSPTVIDSDSSIKMAEQSPYPTGLCNVTSIFQDLLLGESPSLVLVINDTKLLMPCVKCFELGISNTCEEDVCGKEWWPQDHKEMVHGHKMIIMVEMHII